MTAKNPTCPKCGSVRVAEIFYGLPYFSAALERDIEVGKIVLGGCGIKRDSPSWHCNDCRNEWGKPEILQQGNKKEIQRTKKPNDHKPRSANFSAIQ